MAEEEIELGSPTAISLEDDVLGSGFKTILPSGITGSNWQITGHSTQVLTTVLEPGMTIETEPGSMMFMQNTFEQSVDCGCDTCLMRCCAGENCAKTVYENTGGSSAYIGLSPYYPAGIVPISGKDLNLSNDEGTVTAKAGAYFANVGGNVNVDYSCHCCAIDTLCCTGLGPVRQVLSVDSAATAFLSAAGTIVVKDLKSDETIVVDSNSIVSYESTVEPGCQSSGKIGMCCCGGEGCANSTLTGPGRVYIQSTNFAKMKMYWTPAPENSGSAGAESGDE